MGSELSTQSQRTQTCSPKLRHQQSNGTNNLPPILFHSAHGENIRISPEGTMARRSESFCKGIVFSNRPIRVNERICIKFTEMSTSWSGALRFGFTANDPISFRHGLPKYACPDLTNKAGNWAKALGERFAQRDTVLYYYVNEEGEVHYGINGEDKGIFFGGVNTNSPLWALLDVYGNTVAVESVDPRNQLNNRRNSEMDRLVPSLSTLALNRENREPLPQVYRDATFQALPFHKTKGCNIRLSNDRCVAERNSSHYCQGYVFANRSLRLGEKLVLQILQTDELYAGSLAFGLTTCNPATINGSLDLPEDPHMLLDRPEYWVVIKDVANAPIAGDELAFKITEQGEVQMIKNRHPPVTLMHVDATQNLWAFFDLYGSTLKVKILGTVVEDNVLNTQTRNNTMRHQLNSSNTTSNISPSNHNNSTSNLTVRLPSSQNNSQPDIKCELKNVNYATINNSTNNINSGSEGSMNSAIGTECTVCYEASINSVLYMCGHICMCYNCAVQQWKNQGCCPICRAVIRDVIRTYWS